MKQRSVMFDSCWGLAFAAVTPLVIGTDLVISPSAEAAITPFSQSTIYVEADAERQEMGYEGYTITEQAAGYRIEVVGTERHEGTITITANETSVSFNATRDDDSRSLEFHQVGEEYVVVTLDENPAFIVSVDVDGNADMAAMLVPYVDDSVALGLLTSVLDDDNLREAAIEFIEWGTILAIITLVLGTILTLVGFHISNKQHCQGLHSKCQDACWNANDVDCQNWGSTCGGTIPSGNLIDQCCMDVSFFCDPPWYVCMDHCGFLDGCIEELCFD